MKIKEFSWSLNAFNVMKLEEKGQVYQITQGYFMLSMILTKYVRIVVIKCMFKTKNYQNINILSPTL